MTDVGRYRKNNEDAFVAMVLNLHGLRYLGKVGESAEPGCDYVFAVSDGMGGAKSGEFASRTAVDKITQLLPASFSVEASNMASGRTEILNEVFHRVHDEMEKMSFHYEECRGMGATLSLGWFSPGWMHFAHVGDSRIYYLHPGGEMRQLTHDHSYVGSLRRKGKINERQARTHPQKNALSQVMGGGHHHLDPQLGAVRLESGDRFLFCSDGLVDGLWDRAIAEAMVEWDLASMAEKLVEESVKVSGRDNTTCVVVEIA
jgi:protein phosphatase